MLKYLNVRIYRYSCVCLSTADGRLARLQSGAVVTSVTVDNLVHMSTCTYDQGVYLQENQQVIGMSVCNSSVSCSARSIVVVTSDMCFFALHPQTGPRACQPAKLRLSHRGKVVCDGALICILLKINDMERLSPICGPSFVRCLFKMFVLFDGAIYLPKFFYFFFFHVLNKSIHKTSLCYFKMIFSQLFSLPCFLYVCLRP